VSLWRLIVTPHLKGVQAACAVRPTRAPSGGAWGVLDLEALGFEGVRRMELSPVCVIAGFLFCGGVDQDKWWRVMC